MGKRRAWRGGKTRVAHLPMRMKRARHTGEQRKEAASTSLASTLYADFALVPAKTAQICATPTGSARHQMTSA